MLFSLLLVIVHCNQSVPATTSVLDYPLLFNVQFSCVFLSFFTIAFNFCIFLFLSILCRLLLIYSLSISVDGQKIEIFKVVLVRNRECISTWWGVDTYFTFSSKLKWQQTTENRNFYDEPIIAVSAFNFSILKAIFKLVKWST